MLNKSSFVPMSWQIYDIICSRIVNEKYPVGTFLPSQDFFSKEFGVSSITVRRAFHELRVRGIVKPQRGKGTLIICIPSTYQGFHSAGGFTADSKVTLASLETRVMTIKASCPKAEAVEAFQLRGAYPALIQRLRIVNGLPASLEYSYLNPTLLPSVLWEEEILNNHSLYEFIKKKFGYKIVRAEEKIHPQLPSSEVRSILGSAGPILFIQRLTFIEGQTLPFEYCEYYILGEYYGRVVYHMAQP